MKDFFWRIFVGGLTACGLVIPVSLFSDNMGIAEAIISVFCTIPFWLVVDLACNNDKTL